MPKLEEIIEQSLQVAEQYGLESEVRLKRRGEALLFESDAEEVEAGELVGMEK